MALEQNDKSAKVTRRNWRRGMHKRIVAILALCLFMTLLAVVWVGAANVTETEPNDSAAHANALAPNDVLTGAIDPSTDSDYFSLAGVNTTWGYIALLDTIGSSGSHTGTLTALRNDGTTVLQSDTGSWERGSGIALQNYADGSATHYLKVNAGDPGATISSYQLRYYRTITRPQPEVEPNNTPGSGTPAAFTNNGTISSNTDVDCFLFHGRSGDTILLALNGDPEGDTSPISYTLSLIDPSGTTLKTASLEASYKQFIEYTGLASTGAYAFCVSRANGTAGATATYRVGLVRNGGLYFPDYDQKPAWLNPRPGDVAFVGDRLSIRLAMTNTSPITIPGNINLGAVYSATCLSFINSTPPPTTSVPGEANWTGLKANLAPGEVYSITINLLALKPCNDTVYQHTGMDYFFTGTGAEVEYTIGPNLYLPLIRRQ
jgi:hypothetical protein